MMRKFAVTNFFHQSLNSGLAMTGSTSGSTSGSTAGSGGAACGSGRSDDTASLDEATGSRGQSSQQARSATLQRSDTSAGKVPPHPSAEFFQSRSMSVADIQIDNSEPEENIGQIQFGLDYVNSSQTLILRIIQAKELPAKDLSGTSDPYVKITILPDKRQKLVTKIKRRTLHPRWNESFYFEGYSFHQLQSRVLHLHILDYDRFSRDDSIGELFLPLGEVDFSDKRNVWKALKPLEKDINGDLLCSLCYHPSNSQLSLSILKCRSLKAKDINGKSDPYVKVWLNFGEKRIEKRKTPVHKCTLEPVYNETFVFDVPWERIRECSLDVRVMDFDNVGRNELIGRILLAGKGGTGQSEVKHWQDMIAKPRQTLIQWHRLKGE